MTKELLIGCGSRRIKIIDNGKPFDELTTLDINPAHEPDVVWDLTNLPLPFDDETFDEIHAYEVLEHTGAQGDYRFFFAQFSDLWRLLKPDGVLFATVPLASSPWAWGDPSHTRVIPKETLMFLSQAEYEKQVGVTPMSDFRYIYNADFELVYLNENEHTLAFALRAVKNGR